MIEILIVWLIVGVTALGLGLFFTRDLEDAFWLGWVITVAVLLVYHLVAPITPIIGVVLCAISVIGWLRWRPVPKRTWIVAPMIALLLAGFATGPSTEPDDGGYQLQVVKWYAEYPVVPGLANIQGRFGFNNSSLLYNALFAELPSSPTHYGMGVLFIASAVGSLLAAVRLRKSGKWSDFFQALMIFPVALYLKSLMTLETSIAVTLLGFVIAIRLARLLDNSEIDHRLLIIFVAAAITVKLSIIFFAGTALLVAWIVAKPPIRLLVKPLILANLLGLAWVVHGIVLSGMPVFPATIGGLNVDWRVPDVIANIEASQVTIYARYSSPIPIATDGEWGWIPAWWNRIVQLPAIFSTVAMLPALVFAVRRPYRRLLLFAPPIVGLVYWFIIMPSTEFGLASFFTLGLGGLALGVSRKLRKPILSVVLGISLVHVLLYAPYLWNTSLQEQWTSEYETFQFPDGSQYFAPNDNGPCWDTPLPCTLPIQVNGYGVVLRTSELRDGFRSQYSPSR